MAYYNLDRMTKVRKRAEDIKQGDFWAVSLPDGRIVGKKIHNVHLSKEQRNPITGMNPIATIHFDVGTQPESMPLADSHMLEVYEDRESK